MPSILATSGTEYDLLVVFIVSFPGIDWPRVVCSYAGAFFVFEGVGAGAG